MFVHELSKLLSNKLKCISTITNLKVDIEWVYILGYTIAVTFMSVALVIHWTTLRE